MVAHHIPVGNSETVAKAVELAYLALDQENADFGTGFVEGVIEVDGNWFSTVWCAVSSRDRRIGLGGGLMMRLPPNLKDKHLQGELKPKDLEVFVQGLGDNPYEILVRQALIDLQTQTDKTR